MALSKGPDSAPKGNEDVKKGPDQNEEAEKGIFTPNEIKDAIKDGSFDDKLLKLQGEAAVSSNKLVDELFPDEGDTLKGLINKGLNEAAGKAMQEAKEAGPEGSSVDGLMATIDKIRNLGEMSKEQLEQHIDTGLSDFEGDFDLDDSGELEDLVNQIMEGKEGMGSSKSANRLEERSQAVINEIEERKEQEKQKEEQEKKEAEVKGSQENFSKEIQSSVDSRINGLNRFIGQMEGDSSSNTEAMQKFQKDLKSSLSPVIQEATDSLKSGITTAEESSNLAHRTTKQLRNAMRSVEDDLAEAKTPEDFKKVTDKILQSLPNKIRGTFSDETISNLTKDSKNSVQATREREARNREADEPIIEERDARQNVATNAPSVEGYDSSDQKEDVYSRVQKNGLTSTNAAGLGANAWDVMSRMHKM